MELLDITYCFSFPDRTEEVFHIQIDTGTMETVNIPQDDIPEWARLDYHQCPNCTLGTAGHPFCPLMKNIAGIIGKFDLILSYENVRVKVLMKERSVSMQVKADRGISSLMGLVIAASGCPHTFFFKPMARFHLPFASEAETSYRAVSSYTLGEFFRNRRGGQSKMDLDGLKCIYENIQTVNAAVAERIRNATRADSSVNALVALDLFAKAIPYHVDDSFEDLRNLFRDYIGQDV